MARCPFATWKPLPENATQARITPRAAILHTAVDAPGETNLWRYFARGDVGAESHFFVTYSGEIQQFVDTAVMANANRHADQFAISIETEDEGRPEQLPWTPAQLDAIVRLLDWICDTHRIPRRVIESPTGSGIGWHAMWNNSRGETPWSLYRGKTCPGTARVPQIRSIIIPRLVALDLPQEEDDMFSPDDRKALEALSKAVDELTKRVDALAVGPGYMGHKSSGVVPLLNKVAAKLGVAA